MRILQINVTANWGSTGRIAEGIGIAAQKDGFDSWMAWGRYSTHSQSHLIQIGSKLDYIEHGMESRIFDNHGLASRRATAIFLRTVDRITPDLIHLHNIHGYYLNYRTLFQYIKDKNIPVVWTLHDCWPFTGHCCYFDKYGCNRWKKGCFSCPQKNKYPSSYIFDRSQHNYEEKKKCFTSLKELHIVSVSRWLDDLVVQSFLNKEYHLIIHNGIDTELFSPSANRFSIRRMLQITDDEFMLLGVASVWSERKGLHDFIELSKQIPPRHRIVLIGLRKAQIKSLPHNIIGVERTESTKQLAEYYSAADLFLNLTYEDNYPTTNLEAISCGTPCLTYRTGGSPESVTPETGFVVPQGDLEAVMECVETVREKGKQFYSTACRNFALAHFRQEDRFQDYINLYNRILSR